MIQPPIIVIIPTRYHIGMLEDLIPSLSDATKIYIYDNGLLPWQREALETYSQLTIINAYNMTIYEMWNDGWSKAQGEFQNPHIAILNDDIYFKPFTLSHLSKALVDHPLVAAICPDYTVSLKDDTNEYLAQYTTSTFGHGGLAGFAFMLKGELDIPKIDETFQWWYGDDELVKNIMASGYKVAILRGLPIYHEQGSSSKMDSSIEQKISLDMYYFNKKYGENRQRW